MRPLRSGAVAGAAALALLGLLGCAMSPAPQIAPAGPAAQAMLLDDFEDVSTWQAAPATGVEMTLSPDSGVSGGALRVDFDFRGGGGWAALRRELPVRLPENYEIRFWLRGAAPVNTLEFKLIDASGENVWWVNRPQFAFDGAWRPVSFRRRHVTFAWGPAEGGEIRDVAAIELAVTAGSGGRGTIWIDSLTITPRDPVLPYDLTPVVTATSASADMPAASVVDGSSGTAWRSSGGGAQTLTVDFQHMREYGGLVLVWDSASRAIDYDVEVSQDGVAYQIVRSVRGGAGPRDYLYLPETESRWLRLRLQSGVAATYVLRELLVQPIEWAGSRNTLFETVAADALRGHYPKYLTRQQSYWTVIGLNGGDEEALINEEGAVEVGSSAFAVEPFLFANDRLITWADADITQSLLHGYIPVPSVHWAAGVLRLDVTAFAGDEAGVPLLWLTYRVHNTAASPLEPTLFLALRPFQVNPSWQFLNTPGGAATLRTIGYDGAVITADERTVVPVTRAASFGAASFDNGGVIRTLATGRLPDAQSVSDAFGHASAALAYPLRIPPGGTAEVVLAVPLRGRADAHAAAPLAGRPDAGAVARSRLEAVESAWRNDLDRVVIDLPGSAPPLGDLVRSNLAWVLINRDGPAIQPGSRSYERSWIRDGSLTSAALLRLGHENTVREFIEWFAPYQYENGKVPCCVDRRGADPVPEHDSHGQLIYLIAEYFRFTGDTATARQYWSNVLTAVAHIDSLRHLRMTDVYRQPDSIPYFGMVPQSISHEGYAARPMHSYWDAFFVLKGLKDATFLAQLLGHDAERARIGRIRDEFQRDLHASLRSAMQVHAIDFLPGSVELGDFDATSTTVGVTPAGELGALESQLRSTFERYWQNFERRRSGAESWDAYTPYELRTIGTFVRLGQRERAHEALAWFMRDIRPRGWNHWAEVVWRDPAEPKFIGDMPHGWVGSDLIRSVTDMFAYWREDDESLVIAAGILPEWLDAGDTVRIRGLRTPAGIVSYAMTRSARGIELVLEPGVTIPAGGVVIMPPGPLHTAVVDGRTVRADGGGLHLRRWPARVTFR
jgi:hypothetical protein